MSPDGNIYVTQEGLEKLKLELKELKTVKRKEVANRIQEAKELGDLSENAEYSEAKDEQGFIEGRIIELENTIKNASVISAAPNSDIVQVGSTVTLDTESGAKTYTIVGSNEADPLKGLISNESPLGQAFIGTRVGEMIEIKVPKGMVKYKVVAVS